MNLQDFSTLMERSLFVYKGENNERTTEIPDTICTRSVRGSTVLFELGGIVVICDAGGCTGNVCGFDEPRWFEQKSAIFSAGLRDMDAILGRDDRLVAKLADVVQKIDATFVAVIGTPVPAVIATDYLALKRMSEKKIKRQS